MTGIDMSMLALGSCGPGGGIESLTWIGASVALLLGWAWVMTLLAVRQARSATNRTEGTHG